MWSHLLGLHKSSLSHSVSPLNNISWATAHASQASHVTTSHHLNVSTSPCVCGSGEDPLVPKVQVVWVLAFNKFLVVVRFVQHTAQYHLDGLIWMPPSGGRISSHLLHSLCLCIGCLPPIASCCFAKPLKLILPVVQALSAIPLTHQHVGR